MTPGSSAPGHKFFGKGLPYTDVENLTGKLITIEGTDGVGRSLQVAMLKEWLEIQGHGVIETGWTRSELMSETIGAAKAGHTLNQLTFTLLYATDFADRLEKIVIPALRSGFVVLADRYVFTAFARSMVRGADPKWIRDVFGFALVPDLTLYLRINVEDLIPRVLKNRRMDYWEAGMDMHPGADLFESFRRYQGRLIHEYNRMAREFEFVTVEATGTVEDIQARIRKRVQPLLEAAPAQGTEGLETHRPLLFKDEEPQKLARPDAGGASSLLAPGPGTGPSRILV